jgi:hypothetical protein
MNAKRRPAARQAKTPTSQLNLIAPDKNARRRPAACLELANIAHKYMGMMQLRHRDTLRAGRTHAGF